MFKKILPSIWGQKQIPKYTIYRNNEKVETDVLGYRTALAHARKYTESLFIQVKKVEILNQWTGEIVSLQEAEKRAALYEAKRR